MTALLSVLTPVLNEAKDLPVAVAAMRAQRLDGEIEFLFIDGGSTDDTRDILREIGEQDPRVRLLDNPARCTPNGLNIGLRVATGRYVARMDAHTIYQSDYLAKATARLEQGGVAWVSGPQLPRGEGVWSRRVALALRSPLGFGSAVFRQRSHREIEVDSGFTGVWRRDTLLRHGGWDEGWPVNQDGELAARISEEGGRIVCLPEMAAEYIPRDSLRALARQYLRYGQYKVKTVRHHPRALRRAQLLPPSLVATVAIAVIAPALPRRAARAGLLVYGTTLGFASVGRRSDGRPSDVVWLPLIWMIMHLSWGIGFLVGASRVGFPWSGLVHAFTGASTPGRQVTEGRPPFTLSRCGGRSMGALTAPSASSWPRHRLAGVLHAEIVIPLVAVLGSALVGVLVSINPVWGVAAVAAVFFCILTVVDLRVGIVLWLPLLFLEGIPVINLAGKAAGLVIAAVWLGQLIRPAARTSVIETLRTHQTMMLCAVALVVWASVSVLWSPDTSHSLADLWHWYALALLVVVVATTLRDARCLRWAFAAWVAGAALSVVVGAATTGLATRASGRLAGGTGDANFFAVSCVSAIVLAIALGVRRGSVTKIALLPVVVVLLTGLVASQSRGGFIAAVATAIAAFIVFRGARFRVAATAFVAASIAAFVFAVTPGAWERIVSADREGSGRADLWLVAWRVAKDNPLIGTGVDAFPVVASSYVRQPGSSLPEVRFTTDPAQEVHNLYLTLWADLGIVGLMLFLGFAASALTAARKAALRFEAREDHQMAMMARAVIVASAAMLAGGFTLSNHIDKRLWVLVGLGPAVAASVSLMRQRSHAPWPDITHSESGQNTEEAIVVVQPARPDDRVRMRRFRLRWRRGR